MKNPNAAKWVTAWGTATLVAGEEQIPKNPPLSGCTLRQQIRPSISGSTLRLTLSNQFGREPLEIEKMIIARHIDPNSSAIDLSTITPVTVSGRTSFTLQPGEIIMTDPADFDFSAFSDISVSLKLGAVPEILTCHTASRCTAWILPGDHLCDPELSECEEMTSWYFIAGLDTLCGDDFGAIVCFGDSLTDGASVTTNAFKRYTDELARLVHADPEMNRLSVVNRGIGATALYFYGEDCGKKRFERDVLNTAGVKYLVMLYGVNDIGASKDDISQALISEYKSVILTSHAAGIKVYGCTVTPFKGNAYYSELHEKIRKTVNRFILSEDSGFDGVIDLAAAVASQDDPEKMDRRYVSVWNDYLHFNDGGYTFIGQTVYKKLKEFNVK